MTTICTATRDGCNGSAIAGKDNTILDAVFDFVERLTRVGPPPDLNVVSKELRGIFQHDFFACASMRAYDGRLLRTLNVNFPEEFVDSIGFLPGSSSCQLLREWLAKRSPVMFA